MTLNFEQRKIETKKLIGIALDMSLVNNKTAMLWRNMMILLKEMNYSTEVLKYSLQIYPIGFFEAFDPQKVFTKMALIEAQDSEIIPEGMVCFELPRGDYAVFKHVGSSNDNSIFQTIFNDWLPSSEFILDNRPHFELIDKNYKINDPNAEEEIWIPIAPKKQRA